MAITVSYASHASRLTNQTIVPQAPSERIQYILALSEWVSSIDTPTVLKVVDIEDPGTDLSSTVVHSGGASASGTNITLPLIKSLTLGKTYRVHVNFDDGTSDFEALLLIKCRY